MIEEDVYARIVDSPWLADTRVAELTQPGHAQPESEEVQRWRQAVELRICLLQARAQIEKLTGANLTSATYEEVLEAVAAVARKVPEDVVQ